MKIIKPVQVTQDGSFTRASVGTYFDSSGVLQTAVANALRITYDPTNLTAVPYALVEGSATNLVRSSQNLANVQAWGVGAKVSSTTKTYHGIQFQELTKVTSATSESLANPLSGTIPTGQIVYATVALMAGTSSSVHVGLYDSTNTGNTWGTGPSEGGMRIVEGPGSAGASLGASLILVTGLSTTTPTLVEIWRKYTSTSPSAYLYVYPGGYTSTTIGDSVLVTRCQAEFNKSTSYFPTITSFISRPSIGTYFDSAGVLQTAPSNTARINYDPNNLSAAPYLLVENGGTNYGLYSDDVTNAAWDSSIRKGTITSASSNRMAKQLHTEDTTTNQFASRQFITLAFAGNWTISFAFKNNGRRYVSVYPGGASTAYAIFDLQSGVITATGGAQYVSSAIVPLGNGEYRCAVTFSLASSGLVGAYYFLTNSATTPSPTYTGDGVSGVYVGGFQMEGGLAMSSYIPTTNAGYTRSADNTSTAQTRAADVVGATGLLYSNVPETDYPFWSATTLYGTGDRVIDGSTHKCYQSLLGHTGTSYISTQSGTNPIAVTFTDASTGAAYVPAQWQAVQFSTMDPAYTPYLSANTTYYVAAFTNGGVGPAFYLTTAPNSSSYISATFATTTAITNIGTKVSDGLGKVTSNTTYWLPLDADARWKMFDQQIASQTSAANELVVSIYPGSRLDSLALFNISANSISVSMTDTVTGSVVYQNTLRGNYDSGINSWYDYFTKPIVNIQDILLSDLPVALSSTSVVTVRLATPGNTVYCGTLVTGYGDEIGTTEAGVKAGIVDYSVKTKDNFGNYTITPRAFSKKADYSFQIPDALVDYAYNLLASYRSTPVIYVGNNTGATRTYTPTVVYGFFKDFSIDISYPPYSACTLSVEGLA